MTRTPTQRRHMRACALRVLALSIVDAIRMHLPDKRIARLSEWGKVDDELRDDVRLLFGIVATYADDCANDFEAGTRRIVKRGRGKP